MTDNFKHPSFLTDCLSFTSTATQEQDYAALLAERDALRVKLYVAVGNAYKEGYSDGYHTSNPHKTIAGDWLKSDALAQLTKEDEG